MSSSDLIVCLQKIRRLAAPESKYRLGVLIRRVRGNQFSLNSSRGVRDLCILSRAMLRRCFLMERGADIVQFRLWHRRILDMWDAIYPQLDRYPFLFGI